MNRRLPSLIFFALLSWPAAGGAADYDPTADKDHDGVVTNKEARQQRRADRRARRRRPDGSYEDEEAPEEGATVSSDEAAAHEAAAASGGGGGGGASGAASSASGAAQALKALMGPTDAGALPGAGGPGGTDGLKGPSATTGGAAAAHGVVHSGPRGGAITAGGGGATGDPANPNTSSDLALSARSGYGSAFAASGLKLAPDGRTVLRLDGSPASPADLSRLRERIQSMPAAIGRQPDFYNQVSPERYSDLKKGYKERKDLAETVYKDVGTTEKDRDFVHTKSCSKMSGDCNESTKKASYKKGDYVDPGDLDKMWESLQKELDEASDSDDEASGFTMTSGGSSRRVPGIGSLDFDGGDASAAESGYATAATEGSGSATAVSTAAASFPAAATMQRLWTSAVGGLGFSPSKSGGGRSSLLLAALALGVLLAGLGLWLSRRSGDDDQSGEN